MTEQKNADTILFASFFIILSHIILIFAEHILKLSGFSLPLSLAMGITNKIPALITPKILFLPMVISAIHSLQVEGETDIKTNIAAVKRKLLIGLVILIPTALFFPIASFYLKILYAFLVVTGFWLYMTSIGHLKRLFPTNERTDIFNKEKETFPQTTHRIDTDHSVNIPYYFYFEQQWKRGWLNVVNPFRAVLVIGSPGSGKSFGTINLAIAQLIFKGFSMYVYDFKLPTLALEVLNALYFYKEKIKADYGSIEAWEKKTGLNIPNYYQINFSDIAKTNQINPLAPSLIPDILDAQEASKFIMIGLNGPKSVSEGAGDFFQLSAANLLTATIYYLKLLSDRYGIVFSTFPHVIEFLQLPKEVMFPLLMSEPQIASIASTFNNAFKSGATEQLEGQIASLTIPMGQLASDSLYYVFSGQDFDFDIARPGKQSIVVIGNDPARQEIYSIFLSLLNGKLTKVANKQGNRPLAIVVDELPTLPFDTINTTIATARSNKIAVFLGIQDLSQFVEKYGEEKSKQIINMVGTIFSGQIRGEIAETISKAIGQINQTQIQKSIGKDISFNISEQKADAVPVSTIANLSQGEMVGTIADDFAYKIDYRAFHGKIDAMAPDASPVNRDKHPIKENHIIINKAFAKRPDETQEDCELRKKYTIKTMYTNIRQDMKLIVALETARFDSLGIADGQDYMQANYSPIETYYLYEGKEPSPRMQEISDGMQEIRTYYHNYIKTNIAQTSNEADPKMVDGKITKGDKVFFTDFKSDPRLKTLKPVYKTIKEKAVGLFLK